MFLKLLLFFFLLSNLGASEKNGDFIFNGFQDASANMSLDGIAEIEANGLLRLTNTSAQMMGHGFYSHPLQFKDSRNAHAFSFSTVFAFAIIHQDPNLAGHGIAFVVSPSRNLTGAMPSQHLGLFNDTNGDASNPVVAVELDTIQNREFEDTDKNHVGINLNSLISNTSAPAAYFTNEDGYKNLSLRSGKPMLVWVDYSGAEREMNVTLAPISIPKPKLPLLSLKIDLSPIISDYMYVGFSSSTGSLLTSHYILGWSFKMSGQARALDLLRLPPVPRSGSKKKSKLLTVRLPVIVVAFTVVALLCVAYYVRRKLRFAEELEDWEVEYGAHRISYKDLHTACKGFKEKEILGIGGFGRVYKGLLPATSTKIEVAVKRISHDSQQGIREFVAEIATIGRIRHPNLVRLNGYCRRKAELFLIYDYMPNGSLDKFLFGNNSTLDWRQRFQVIKDVASGLLHLHEEWVQIILHRDIKASNVLLDHDFKAKLGDFGLARLYDHGENPRTTQVVGSLGYIAPELARTGKASTFTDVFSFGAFMLEVGCGRRPVETQASSPENVILVDWVSECQRRGDIVEAADPKLKGSYVLEEMELVLKLGLLCSHPLPAFRPSIKQVIELLYGNTNLCDLWSDGISSTTVEGFDQYLSPAYASPDQSASLLSRVVQSF